MAAKIEKVKLYSNHLTDVFTDRRLLDTLIEFSPKCMTDMLLVMGDGMDQAHFRLPRDPGLKTVKALASFKRPQVTVHLMWVSHLRMDFYVVDTDVPHDSSMITECLAQTLERCCVQLREQGKDMPRS